MKHLLLIFLLAITYSSFALPYPLRVSIVDADIEQVPLLSYNGMKWVVSPDSTAHEEHITHYFFQNHHRVSVSGHILYASGEYNIPVLVPREGQSQLRIHPSDAVQYTGSLAGANEWFAKFIDLDGYLEPLFQAEHPIEKLNEDRTQSLDTWRTFEDELDPQLWQLVQDEIVVFYTDAYVVLAWNQVIPTTVPQGDAIRDSVTNLPVMQSATVWATAHTEKLVRDMMYIGSRPENPKLTRLIMHYAMDHINPISTEEYLRTQLADMAIKSYSFDDPELLAMYYAFAERYPDNPRLANLRWRFNPYINFAEGEISEFTDAKLHWEDSTLTSLREILEPYRGKVVYVDLWGSWCAPCINELKTTYIAGHEAFPDHPDLVKVYIAHEYPNSNPAKVEGVIKSLEVKGEHYFKRLVKPIYTDFTSLRYYPTFLIVDQNGEIHAENIYRPSDGEKLYKQLMGFLEPAEH